MRITVFRETVSESGFYFRFLIELEDIEKCIIGKSIKLDYFGRYTVDSVMDLRSLYVERDVAEEKEREYIEVLTKSFSDLFRKVQEDIGYRKELQIKL